MLPKKLPHLVYRPRTPAVVNDRVAVRAHRAQVSDRIDYVLATDLGQRPEVVDMDETGELRPVDRAEVETADDARRAPSGLALDDGVAAALVGVDGNSPGRALNVNSRLRDLPW